MVICDDQRQNGVYWKSSHPCESAVVSEQLPRSLRTPVSISYVQSLAFLTTRRVSTEQHCLIAQGHFSKALL